MRTLSRVSPVLAAPDDHAAAPVQVDADILCLVFHGSLLPSTTGWFRNPKCAAHTWSRSTGGLSWGHLLAPGRWGDALSGHATVPRFRRPARCAPPGPSRRSGAALLHHIRTVRRIGPHVRRTPLCSFQASRSFLAPHPAPMAPNCPSVPAMYGAVHRSADRAILSGFILGVAHVKFEVWAGDGGNAIGYVLIPATEAKRQKMGLVASVAMQECIATFEAESWDEATVRLRRHVIWAYRSQGGRLQAVWRRGLVAGGCSGSWRIHTGL